MNALPFDRFAEEYDSWYEEYPAILESEINAIKPHLPLEILSIKTLEIGVGTGRFAERLKVEYGVDPSLNMIKIAKKRGIKVVLGVAESLPFLEKSFDLVLMITTLCFLKKPEEALREVKRILKSKGRFVIGIIDRESPLGKIYEAKKEKSKFYKYANFFSVEEVLKLLEKTGFKILKITQTLFQNPKDIKIQEEFKEGFGEGGFVVISAEKS
jgi:ubiquinone/menaquinone biosynthesis C-methylase UbiE